MIGVGQGQEQQLPLATTPPHQTLRGLSQQPLGRRPTKTWGWPDAGNWIDEFFTCVTLDRLLGN